MGLSASLLRSVLRKGYKVPTPIQRRCIPLILDGKDVVGMARTGSGKTAAFVIPMLERLRGHSAKFGARGIILSPSRELAMQTLKVVTELGRFQDLRSALLVGGDSLDDQFSAMAGNPDILIATPGRLLHLLVEMDLKLHSVEYIVFDEADRLFEMGFAEQLREILNRLPSTRTTLLFSATLPRLLVDFAKAGLNEPVLVRLDTDAKLSSDLKLHFFGTRPEDRSALLVYMLREVIPTGQQTLVFVSTRHHAEHLQRLLDLVGIESRCIYGAMDATARKIALARFRNNSLNVLLVTDVASRGIDIPLLDNVINYDFPPRPKVFIHRTGRVARAGRAGTAYSFITPDELPFVVDLSLFLGRPFALAPPAGSNQPPADANTVVYGLVPPTTIDIEREQVAKCHSDSVELFNMRHVASNAFKMYLRSRPAASAESHARAKEMAATQIFGPHPLLAAKLGTEDLVRTSLLDQLKTFRPTKGPQSVIASDFGATVRRRIRAAPSAVSVFGNADSSRAALEPDDDDDDEVDLSHEFVRDNKRKRPLPASSEPDDEEMDSGDEQTEEEENDDSAFLEVEGDDDDGFLPISGNKRRPSASADSKTKVGKRTSFRDEEHYMSYQKSDRYTEAGYSMKDPAARSFSEAARDAVFDLTADDTSGLQRDRSRLQWDRKKKKYVRTGGMDGGAKGEKMIRTESGALIPASYKTDAFQEWQKRHGTGTMRVGQDESKLKFVKRKDGRRVLAGGKGGKGRFDDEAAHAEPQGKNGKRAGASQGGQSPAKRQRTDGSKAKSELKPADRIRKERKIKEKKQKFMRERRQINAQKKKGGGMRSKKR